MVVVAAAAVVEAVVWGQLGAAIAEATRAERATVYFILLGLGGSCNE